MPSTSSRRIATVKDLQPEDAPLCTHPSYMRDDLVSELFFFVLDGAVARMEAMGIRLLSEHGYPPDKQK